MKSTCIHTIAYERPGPVSDMYVGRAVVITLGATAPTRRAPSAIFALLLLIAVPVLLHEGGTIAYFSDLEGASGNTFAAGPLAFSVGADYGDATLIAGASGESFALTVTPAADSLPITYGVVASTTGDAAFCNAIGANGEAPLAYNGPLTALSTGPTDSLGSWTLTLTLPPAPPGVVDGMTCTVDLAYRGYQQGGAAGTEYHDDKHVLLTLTADPPLVSPPATSSLDTLMSGGETTDTPAVDSPIAIPPVGDVPPADLPALDTPPTVPTTDIPDTNVSSTPADDPAPAPDPTLPPSEAPPDPPAT